MKKIFSIFALFIVLGLFSACSENSDDAKPMESVSPSVEVSTTEDSRVQQMPPLNTSEIVCTQEAKICPDGTSVGRTGPNCEFPECEKNIVICPQDMKTCPNGMSVSRMGPNCEFPECPDILPTLRSENF